ncbi:MAG: hypothetical protein SNJ69_07925 [Chloroflexaceae bacterium]
MKQLFLIAAIFALIALIGANFVAADPWRLPLLLLAGICGLVLSLVRVLAFDRTLTRGQRIVSILYEATFWLVVIGLFLLFVR